MHNTVKFSMNFRLVSVVVFASICCASCFQYSESDVINVHYYEGLMTTFLKYKVILKGLNIYHGAVVFEHEASGQYDLYEYYAPEFVAAVFPYVVNNEVIFENDAVVGVGHTLDPEVWQKDTKVAIITGDIYSKFLEWVPTYNETKPKYFFWDVWRHWDEELLMKSQTCLEFVWDALEVLYKEGAKFDYSKQIRRDFVNWYSDILEEVDYNDPQWHDKITQFYRTFTFKNESILDLVADIVKFGPEDKFVYGLGGSYYHVHLKYPFVNYHYSYSPLPGAP